MKIIEIAKNKLTQKAMTNFLLSIKNSINVENQIKITFDNIDDVEITTTKENLQKTLFSEDVVTLLEIAEKINISDENFMLKFDKFDYEWWNKDETRRAKLFSGLDLKEKNDARHIKVEKKVVEEKKYSIASGIRTENEEIDKVEIFEGTEKEILKWINGQLQLLTVETFFTNNKIVFCLEPNVEEKEWYTVEELISVGIFEAK